jgi:hypothetical protein
MTDEEMPPEVREYFSRRMKKIAKAGGEARAKALTASQRKRIAKKASDAVALTPEQRKARAQKAAAARWEKEKAAKKAAKKK